MTVGWWAPGPVQHLICCRLPTVGFEATFPAPYAAPRTCCADTQCQNRLEPALRRVMLRRQQRAPITVVRSLERASYWPTDRCAGRSGNGSGWSLTWLALFSRMHRCGQRSGTVSSSINSLVLGRMPRHHSNAAAACSTSIPTPSASLLHARLPARARNGVRPLA